MRRIYTACVLGGGYNDKQYPNTVIARRCYLNCKTTFHLVLLTTLRILHQRSDDPGLLRQS